MQPGYRPPAGERWSVNMPAVIGVVFVFLLGVVVWVIGSSGDDDADVVDDPVAVASQPTAPSVTDAPPPATATATVPPTTSPQPLPSTTVTPTTAPATTAPSTTAPPTTEPSPPTTAAGATDGAVPGDLAVPGRPMSQPPCDGAYITVLASPVGSQATGASLATVLDRYPDANYLRADQTCPSLRSSVEGAPVYVVYLGPFAVDTDACEARAEGPDDAYARRLSTELGPDHSVACA